MDTGVIMMNWIVKGILFIVCFILFRISESERFKVMNIPKLEKKQRWISGVLSGALGFIAMIGTGC